MKRYRTGGPPRTRRRTRLSAGLRGSDDIGSKGEMKPVLVVAGVIIENGRVLITQRRKGDRHGLLWEFPGGKVKEEEEPREGLKRELKEELDIEVKVGRLLRVVYHTYPEYSILLLVYGCRMERGVPKPLECSDLRWVRPMELGSFDMSPADAPIREDLRSHFETASFTAGTDRR